MTNEPQSGLAGPLQVVMLSTVRVSAVCLLAGLVLWFVQRDSDTASSLLNGGIVFLMATPILRVLASAAEAIRVRDWLHVATILAVAGLLALTLTMATRA